MLYGPRIGVRSVGSGYVSEQKDDVESTEYQVEELGWIFQILGRW